MSVHSPSWRPVWLLALSQALFFCSLSIVFTLSGLAGAWLAPAPAYATLPLALMGVTTALAAFFAVPGFALLGRRRVFMLGALGGVLGAGACVLALATGSFAGFCLATTLIGLFQGSAQHYRLAAADVAPTAALRPRAISLVMAGGLLAAFVGPLLAAGSRDLLPLPFAGAYLVAGAMATLAMLVLALWQEPASTAPGALPAWRPALAEIAERPRLRLGMLFCICSYGMMVLVMNAAPLAIIGCGLPLGSAASTVQWHLVGMFAPAFVTGALIERWGTSRVALGGCGLAVAGCLAALGGETSLLFHLSMTAVGIGWCLAYIGGSALLVESASTHNRPRLLGVNEALTFALVTLGALVAGFVQADLGWSGVAVAGIVLLLPPLLASLAGGRAARPAGAQ